MVTLILVATASLCFRMLSTLVLERTCTYYIAEQTLPMAMLSLELSPRGAGYTVKEKSLWNLILAIL